MTLTTVVRGWLLSSDLCGLQAGNDQRWDHQPVRMSRDDLAAVLTLAAGWWFRG